MKLLNRLNAFAVKASLLLSPLWLAHSGFSSEAEIEVVSSYRDHDVIDKYRKEAEQISLAAERLGYSMPKKHLLTFVPAGDLGQLSALGRYALPHWYDGAQIFSSMGRVSGVLEFVVKGDPACKSFYSDTTSYIQQISIIMHVIGHNDFGLNSGYALSTNNYTMPASLELYEYIRKLYEELDHEEVSLFIQWLYSVQYLQDFVDGSYEVPESFQKKSPTIHELKEFKTKAIEQGRDQIRPFVNETSSPSVLSAAVYNMEKTAPEWKKELIRKFEKMVRHYPGNVQTKIINEGWATFSQYLLTKHTHWNEREDAFVELGELMSGVAYPKLSNPYWLGLEAWKNSYKNFSKANKEKYGSEFELDKAFVAHAHDIMAWQSSYDFLRNSLDENWVRDEKLMMYRSPSQEELQKFCGQNQECYPKQDEQAFIVTSRSPERIINQIAREQADHSLMFPKIVLKNLNDKHNGGVLLEHEVRNGFPLDLMSSSQALYVFSLILERPVSLKTIVYGQVSKEDPTLAKADIVIHLTPSGKLSLDGESGLEELEKQLQEAIDIYIADLEFSETDRLTSYRKNRFESDIRQKLVNQIFSDAQDSSSHHSHGSFITHAPTTGQALLEYEAVLSERFSRMLELAVQGKVNVGKTKNGVRFRVLPMIPQFGLDQRMQQKLLSSLPLSPVDDRSSLPTKGYQFGQDDNSEIGRSKNLLPGDIFKQKKNQGQGQGESEEQEGDPEDGDPEESEAGEGGQDPSEVEIPLADWGKALQEELGLPNLRLTLHGESRFMKKKKLGTIHRDHGDIVYRKTLPAALLYPMADDILNDKDFDFGNIVDKIMEGITHIGPADYVVRNHKEVPKPHNKAVVVVVMDFSGSMQGAPHQAAANLVYNFKALLMSQYEDIEFRYVVYDTQAREFTEDQVFGKNPQFLGGGTSNIAGFEFAEKVLEEYNYDEWNKYVLGLGDAGANDGAETVEVMNRMYKESQYMAYVFTDNGWGADQDYLTAMKGFSESHKWAGYSELKDASQKSVLKVLKELFPAE